MCVCLLKGGRVTEHFFFFFAFCFFLLSFVLLFACAKHCAAMQEATVGVAKEATPSTTTSVEDELNDCWKCQGVGTVTKKTRGKKARKQQRQVPTGVVQKPSLQSEIVGGPNSNHQNKPGDPAQIKRGHVELHTVKCPVCQGSKRPASRKRRLALAGQDKACATVTKRVGMPGWTRPGPPATGADDPRATIGTAEQLCCLVGQWRLFQQIGGYRWVAMTAFGFFATARVRQSARLPVSSMKFVCDLLERYSTDDVVTAWVAATTMRRLFLDSHSSARRSCDGTGLSRRLHCADIGCGIGSVLLMAAWMLRGSNAQLPDQSLQSEQCNGTDTAEKDPCARLDSSPKHNSRDTLPCVSVGVEAQPSRLALAHKSIIYNGASDRVAAIHGDLRDLIPEKLIQTGATGSNVTEGVAAASGGAGDKKNGQRAVVSPAILHGAIPVGDGGDAGIAQGGNEDISLPSKILSTLSRLCKDVAELPPTKAPSVAVFDLVTGTPPYFDVKQGGLGAQVASAKCLFEYRGGIEVRVITSDERAIEYH